MFPRRWKDTRGYKDWLKMNASGRHIEWVVALRRKEVILSEPGEVLVGRSAIKVRTFVGVHKRCSWQSEGSIGGELERLVEKKLEKAVLSKSALSCLEMADLESDFRIGIRVLFFLRDLT